MTWTSHEYWMLAIGMLTAAACAIPGTFLLLRRMSLMGDAISHAVLPGLAAGFVLSGSRSGWPIFVGAVVAGVLTSYLTESVRRWGKVDEGASLGVVFTSLFAIGLLLVHAYGQRADLDPSCVLYGELEYAPFKTIAEHSSVPRSFVWLAVTFVVNAGLVAALFKEFRITSFDAGLATSMGIAATPMHYLLMTMTAVTTVAAFESVGSILVIAMLVVPAAAAHLLSDRLSNTVVLAVLIAVVSAALGQWMALEGTRQFGLQSLPTSGMTAVAAGLLLLVAVVASPRHGMLVRWSDRSRLRLRIAREDVLGTLARFEESGRWRVARHELQPHVEARGPLLYAALWSLRRSGAIDDSSDLALTDHGRDRALELLRRHRLWESYLVSRADLSPDHTHERAHRLEHVQIDPASIDAAAGHPRRDPHDRPIP